jgi:hypothetical protein
MRYGFQLNILRDILQEQYRDALWILSEFIWAVDRRC